MRLLCFLLVTSAAMAVDVNDTESELGARYGYLVIDTIVGRPATNWALSDGMVIEKLPLGRNTWLVRLREGSYHWNEIEVPYFDLPHRIDTTDDSEWGFTVESQSINYAGSLVVDELRAKDAAGVRFINRSSEIGALLREKYPELVDGFEIRFAGTYRDDYLSLYGNEAAHAPAD